MLFVYKVIALVLKEINGQDLLDEVVQISPPPVVDLMTGLVGTLDPELTQVRYLEIGPVKWWLQNVWRCPKIAKLLKGNRLYSDYELSGVSIQLTNLPIYSQMTDRSGLRFLELRLQMSLLTDHMLSQGEELVHCKYYLRDAWGDKEGIENAGGMLVSFKDVFQI